MYYHLTNISSRRCTVTLTQIHTSKVKVTWDSVRCYKSRTHFPSFFSQNNRDIDLTYTTLNLNNKYPSITCLYIQEYLGYLSNNLYFLFSDSWQVALYNILVRFNVPVRLREKQNFLKKMARDPLDCLVMFATVWMIFNGWKYQNSLMVKPYSTTLAVLFYSLLLFTIHDFSNWFIHSMTPFKFTTV